jgi:4a-hydroxytetrahydrobiopterin dehydratase
MAAAIFRGGLLTVGKADDPAAGAVNAMGAEHVACETAGVVCDDENLIVSTPAYMTGTTLPDIRTGIKKMVDQVLTWSASGVAREALDILPGWHLESGHLRREWSFPDFVSALAFVEQLGALAETHGHHPDLELGWGRVALTLFTHDANAITDKDIKLAKEIHAISS